ncbi:ABC transporter permease [Micromonospora sp. NPDC048835]|uniref:ABC transporter permease n=1 Tax=Micromonospora sp. NPDC048835 TaxID=3155147 RepID=UPI003402010B
MAEHGTVTRAHAGPTADEISLAETIGRDLRTVRVMWQRELIRLLRSPYGILLSLLMPLLFLVVLGTGMNATVAGGVDFRAYFLPGVILMAVQGPAVNTGISIVWDRRSGFLREMLVAPVRRSALMTGICLGGATSATAYGAAVLATALLIGMTYQPARLVLVLMEMLVVTLAFTALGALAAVSVQRIEMFQAVVGTAMMPMVFLSGALFPVSVLPGPLNVLALLNPMTYAVDAIRRTLDDATAGALPGPQWAGWQPPVALEVTLVGTVAMLAVVGAARRFSRVT